MNNIKKYRGIFGISQKKLAEMTGISRTTCNYLEKNEKYKLPIEYAKKMAKIFNCSVVEVYGDDILSYHPSKDIDKIKIINIVYNSIKDEQLKNKIHFEDDIWDF